MRTAFIGTSSLTLSTAETLLAAGHEVILIAHQDTIDSLCERWPADTEDHS